MLKPYLLLKLSGTSHLYRQSFRANEISMTAQQPLHFRRLHTADEPIVRAWLSDYLHRHISGWLSTHGLKWEPNQISKHIDTHDLVARDWRELDESVGKSDSFVEVVLNNEEVVGIVHATLRNDRYLCIPLGTVDWLYVSRAMRGRCISTTLIKRATTWMQGRGVSAAEVFVTESNVSAVRCYERNRFQRLDLRMVSALI